MTVRWAEPTDLPALWTLAQRFAASAGGRLGIGRPQLEAHYCRGAAGCHPTLLAQQGDLPLGFLALGPAQRPREVKALFVDQAARGGGIGRQLVACSGGHFAFALPGKAGFYAALGWRLTDSALGLCDYPSRRRPLTNAETGDRTGQKTGGKTGHPCDPMAVTPLVDVTCELEDGAQAAEFRWQPGELADWQRRLSALRQRQIGDYALLLPDLDGQQPAAPLWRELRLSALPVTLCRAPL